MTPTPKSRSSSPRPAPSGAAVSSSQQWLAPPGDPEGISRDLARQIVVGYTSPGDCVIDVGKDVDLGDACLRAGRRYHALEGTEHLAGIGHAAGYIDLLYLRWPAAVANDQWLLIACAALLRGTGQLMCVLDTHHARRSAHGASGPRAAQQVATIAESARLARLQIHELIEVHDCRDALSRRTPAPAPAQQAHTMLMILSFDAKQTTGVHQQ